MAVVLSTQLTGSLFDLENDIESLIKSAPNNANRVGHCTLKESVHLKNNISKKPLLD